jgi:hypothetical protein
MITKSEWRAVSRQVMADEGRKLGDPPTAEEMLAYSRGQLTPEEEARVRERLVCHPDLVRTLTVPFPTEGAEPGDPDFLPDEEFARHWASLRKRMKPRTERDAGRVLQFTRVFAAIAATLAVVFGAMLWEANRRAKLPQVWEDQVLYPDGARGPEAAPVLTAQGESIVLLTPLHGAHYDRYRLELVDLDTNRVVWKKPAPRVRDTDSFVIVIPRVFLSPGRYQVAVYGSGPEREQQVGTYSFRVPRR